MQHGGVEAVFIQRQGKGLAGAHIVEGGHLPVQAEIVDPEDADLVKVLLLPRLGKLGGGWIADVVFAGGVGGIGGGGVLIYGDVDCLDVGLLPEVGIGFEHERAVVLPGADIVWTAPTLAGGTLGEACRSTCC